MVLWGGGSSNVSSIRYAVARGDTGQRGTEGTATAAHDRSGMLCYCPIGCWRAVRPTIRVPTLVVSTPTTRDHAAMGTVVAITRSGARYVELPGRNLYT